MAREFTKVGVVGLGTMGAGIVEVFARARPRGGRRGARRRRPPARASSTSNPQPRERSKRGKLSEDEKDAIFDRITFTTPMDDLADCHLVVEAVPEKLELKQQIFAELDAHHLARRDPGHQHLLPVGDRDLRRHPPPGAGDRPALLQPGTGAEAGRGDSHRRDRRRGRSTTSRRWQNASARCPSWLGTRRDSSPTPCSSATSTTRRRCTSSATPPARTSTPR